MPAGKDMLSRMEIVTTKSALRQALAARRAQGKVVLLPTMGALHIGHYTLMDKAREIAGPEGTVVVSLFVNPIQFNNAGDLATYPRTFEADRDGCEAHGADLLFSPESGEMYAGDRTIDITESRLSSRLCGASRPGHFSGVCTVVAKLFNLVNPTDAVFGKKDYQQLAIIRRLVRDLDMTVRIHGAEIVRQADGLANSSRNARLTEGQRKDATVLYRALTAAREAFAAGEKSASVLTAMVRGMIEQTPGTFIDYVELADAETLQPVECLERPAVMALAVCFGDVRLIDNLEF